jgi:hypothetical protein
MAIQRTAPTLLGVFCVVRLMAHQYMTKSSAPEAARQTAWYDKRHPTFSDALALVRKELWAQEMSFCGSAKEVETVKVAREFVERLTEAVCYAA